MFNLIIAALFVIAAFFFIAKNPTTSAKKDVYGRQTAPGTSLRWLAVPLLLLAGLFVVLSSIFRLDAGEAAVVKSISGKVNSDPVTSPGFHTKAPWNSAQKFDVRNQVISFSGTNGGAKYEDDGIQDVRITAQTSDNATAYMDLTLQYSIDPNKVVNIYKAYKTQDSLKSRKLLPGIRGAVQLAPARFATSSLRQSRPEVAAQMKKDVEANLTQAGLTVESIDLRSIAFDREVEANLNAVQSARAQSDRAREELNTARISADKVRVDAQAQSDADQITRCGATSVPTKETINGKEVTTVKVIPVPASRCQNRLNEQVLTSKYIEMLTVAAEKGHPMYVVPQGANNLLQLPAQPTK